MLRAGEGIAPADVYVVLGGHPVVAWFAFDWRFHLCVRGMSVRPTLLAALGLAGLALAACATAGGGPTGSRHPSPTGAEERAPAATATSTSAATSRPEAGASPTVRSTPAPAAATFAPAPLPTTAIDLTFTGAIATRVRTANASNPCGKADLGGFGADLYLTLSGQSSLLGIGLLDYHGPGTYAIPPERVSLRVGPPTSGQVLTAVKGSVTIDASERAGKIDAALGDGSTHVTGAWSCI
jgi:hypothetical protein